MSNNDENKNTEGGIFDEPKPRYTAKSKHKDEFKRQIRLLVTVLLAALVAVAVYLFVIKPIVEHVDEVPEEKVELLEGEVLGPQDRIIIMEYIKSDNIASVEIHNEHGEFGVVYDEESDGFIIKDDPGAAYDKEKVMTLLTNAGYTLAMERITDNAENFGEYGLSELDDPAWYIITDRSGNSHKLYIGDLLPSNAGYYVRYDGRNAVYVLDYTIADSLLVPIEDMISPTLALPVGASDYYTINNFALKKNGELFIALEYLEETERPEGTTVVHRFLYPTSGYTPNDTNYLNVFSLFQNYAGTSTLVYKPTMEDVVKYGLDDPAYDLYFEYKGIPQNIIFGERNDNGNFYAYSPLFDIITEVESANADWLEWGLIDWIERPIFQMNIIAVDSIELECGEAHLCFKLESDDSELLSVTETVSGMQLEDLSNFKKFYQTILMTQMQDYVDKTSEELNDLVSGGEYLKLVITAENGSVRDYRFYPYETRRSYYTVNGVGDFYILRDRMVKIFNDAQKVISGEPVIPDANN